MSESPLNAIQVEIPRAAMEQIARDVFAESFADARPSVQDAEADRIAIMLQRINAKQFITIPELGVLFNCSRGHVDKLLEQAQLPTTQFPIPYIDLNGLIQFERLAVLEWARQAKPFQKNRRNTGGKKKQFPRAVNG